MIFFLKCFYILASFFIECLLIFLFQLYATLDEAAMRAPNNRKTPEEERPEPTQYASIEFGKTEEVPKADLV